jgi:hypothetical protein
LAEGAIGVVIIGTDAEAAVVEEEQVLSAGHRRAVLGSALARDAGRAARLAEKGHRCRDELSVGARNVTHSVSDVFVVNRGRIVAANSARSES